MVLCTTSCARQSTGLAASSSSRSCAASSSGRAPPRRAAHWWRPSWPPSQSLSVQQCQSKALRSAAAGCARPPRRRRRRLRTRWPVAVAGSASVRGHLARLRVKKQEARRGRTSESAVEKARSRSVNSSSVRLGSVSLCLFAARVHVSAALVPRGRAEAARRTLTACVHREGAIASAQESSRTSSRRNARSRFISATCAGSSSAASSSRAQEESDAQVEPTRRGGGRLVRRAAASRGSCARARRGRPRHEARPRTLRTTGIVSSSRRG